MNNKEAVKTTEEICMMLKKMKLSGMADELNKQTKNPNIDLIPFDQRISEIVEAEWDTRYNNKLARYLKKQDLDIQMHHLMNQSMNRIENLIQMRLKDY